MQIKTKIQFHAQHSGKREKSARPRWRGGEISVSRVLVDVCTGTASLEKTGQYLVIKESSASCRWMPACPHALLYPVLPTTSCWALGEKPTPDGWLQSPDLWKCMRLRVCTYMQCKHVHSTCGYLSACEYMCIGMCTHAYACMCIYACTCPCSMHTSMHIHVCITMAMSMCMHVHVHR